MKHQSSRFMITKGLGEEFVKVYAFRGNGYCKTYDKPTRSSLNRIEAMTYSYITHALLNKRTITVFVWDLRTGVLS